MKKGIKPPYKHLTPFKRCVLQNFPFIEADFDALTNYGLLCKIVEYLNKVIASQNEVQTNVETLNNAFIELKNYVDNYFDNLDVQEEINNKLDEMAESGELERIITQYYQGYINVIFPVYGADGEDTLGDCSIIKNGDESLMIDTFTGIIDETYDSIRDALYNAGISTLTYLVITHYHGDHIGNVLNLLSYGYLAGCTVYLPRATTINDVTYDGAAIKTALTNAGVTWIEINNQTFTVGEDCNVKMLNGSAADYQYYDDLESESGNNAYNDRSIVCDVEYKGRRLLFTGDLEYRGCEYIAPQLSASNYDLLKDMHHGFIDNAPDFCAKVNPDYVLIPASAGMVNKNYSDWLINSVYWVRKSKNVMIQGYQSKEINLKIDILGIHPNKEVNFVNNLDCKGATNYYVDYDTADEIRTGSTDHPFKTLNEAAIFLQKNTANEIRINVKSLPITQRTLYIEGFKYLHIVFDSGVQVKNSVTIENCERVNIESMVQTSGTLNVNYSNVFLNKYTNTSGGKCITTNNSKVNIYGELTLNINTDNAIDVRSMSELVINTDANKLSLSYLNSTTKRFLTGLNSKIYINTNAISYLSALPFHTKIMMVGDLNTCSLNNQCSDIRALYKDDTGTYSGAEMKEALAGNLLTIKYADKDGFQGQVRVNRWNNHNITSIAKKSDGTETYIRSANVTFSDNTFTLVGNTETTIRNDGTVSVTNTGNYIKITGIYLEGGYI